MLFDLVSFVHEEVLVETLQADRLQVTQMPTKYLPYLGQIYQPLEPRHIPDGPLSASCKRIPTTAPPDHVQLYTWRLLAALVAIHQ